MPHDVMVVIGSLDVGGAERQMATLLARLDPDRWRVAVTTLRRRGPLAATLEAAGVTVYTPPFAAFLDRAGRGGRLVKIALAAGTLWARLVWRRPAIVHFVLPAAYLVGAVCAVLAGRQRRVMSRRSLAHYQRKYPVLARLERYLHRYMDLIVANSAAVRADLVREGVPDECLVLIRNGVATDTFCPDAAARAHAPRPRPCRRRRRNGDRRQLDCLQGSRRTAGSTRHGCHAIAGRLAAVMRRLR